LAQGQLGTNAQNAVGGLLPLLGETAAGGSAADPYARCAFVDGACARCCCCARAVRRTSAALSRAIFLSHPSRVSGAAGGAAVRVSYRDEERELSTEQLVAMLLARLATHAGRAHGGAATVRRTVLCAPPAFTPRQCRALLDAAAIAGLPQPALVPAHAAAASCYGVKRAVKEGEPPRRVAFVDVGQRYTSAAVYDFAHRATPALLSSGGVALGAADCDAALWDVLAAELRASHGTDVTRASRPGVRLLGEASKAKRTLSTVATVSVELECFGPAEKDIRLTVTRDRFETACAPLRTQLEAFLRGVFAAAAGAPAVAVEVIGGAARVPWVAATIAAAADGVPLSHMLDGACSCALGAAYIAQAHPDDRAFPAAFPPPVVLPSSGDELPAGLDAATLASFRAAEEDMAAADAAAVALADAWNALEAYVLEMRAAASSGPLAAELQPAQSLPLLAAAEDWMNDARDSGETVPLADVTARLQSVREALHTLAPGYFAKLAEKKAALEVRCVRVRACHFGRSRLHTSNQSRPFSVAGPDIVKCKIETDSGGLGSFSDYP
jgi:hypothetical protein